MTEFDKTARHPSGQGGTTSGSGGTYRRPVLSGLGVALLAGAVALAVTPGGAVAATTDGTTYRVSLNKTGGDPNLPSTRERISANGSFVVFESNATNLVASPIDKNRVSDVFWSNMSDPANPSTKRVSVGYDGSDANGRSSFCDVSADGRYVVFNSGATNLVPGWTHSGDVYIRDMWNTNLATATKVVSTNGGAKPNGRSERPTVSDDGRYVAFNSYATNLVSGSSNPGDIYVRDMNATGAASILRVTTTPAASGDDSLRAEISGDGTHLAFVSDVAISANDTNAKRDVYEADITPWITSGGAATISLVSIGRDGLSGKGISTRPGISEDGSVVTFQSYAFNLVDKDTNKVQDAFWRNTVTRVTKLVSTDPSGGLLTAISSRPIPNATGQFVVFESSSAKVVAGDTNKLPDAFLKDMTTGVTTRITVNPAGNDGTCATAASGTTTRPYISASGEQIAFLTGMCNLVGPGTGGPDTNGKQDIFWRTMSRMP